jgi:hypothetical protein
VAWAEPTLRNVVEADLGDDRRLSALFARAVERKWVSDCDGDRLNFWAAAEHARAVGRRNAPGLFIWVVRERKWSFITQRDEDCARLRLVQRRSRPNKVYHRVSRETWSRAGAICESVLGLLTEQHPDSTIGRQEWTQALIQRPA